MASTRELANVDEGVDEIDGGMELEVPRRAFADLSVLDDVGVPMLVAVSRTSDSVALLPELNNNEDSDGDTGGASGGNLKPFVKSITSDVVEGAVVS